MKIELSSDEVAFIKTGIRVGQFESVLPEASKNRLMDGLMKKLHMDEWLLVCGENYFTLVEEYQCSECGMIVSGGPPERCPYCEAINTYRGNSVIGLIEGDE